MCKDVWIVTRLCNFRKQAAELKELAKNLKTNQEKIAELTSSGDLASCFEIHEKTNDFTKKATELASSLTDNDECNTLLINTLEYKMKAAGEISEYEQAQMLKNAIEV